MTAALAMPASAATQEGAVQYKWNVAATATMTLVTNYTSGAPAAQGLGANTLLASPAGTCTSGTSETAFTLTFGQLTPQSAAEASCTYKDAVAATITTNDSSGYKVQEWLDQAPTTGIQFCAFPNNTGVATLNAPASVDSTAPAAISGTTCATGGNLLPAGTSPTGSGPGNPGTAGIRASTAPTTPYTWVSTTTTAASLVYGEDIQINLAANQAASTTDTSYTIISLVLN